MKKVNILFSDRFITRFMQHADMFERFKVIVTPLVTATVVDDFGPTHVEAIRKEAENSYPLVAIYDETTVYYRDKNVKAISTGLEWGLLDDLLEGKHEQKSQAVVDGPGVGTGHRHQNPRHQSGKHGR